MFSIFSFSDNVNLPTQPLDLQLLSEDELLSIWEQTQFAELVLADKGIIPRNVNNYAKIVEMEIQQRAMQDSNILILSAILNKEPYRNLSVNDDFDLFE